MVRRRDAELDSETLPPLPDFSWCDVFVVAISAVVCALTVQEFPAVNAVPKGVPLGLCRARAIAFILQFLSVAFVVLAHLQHPMHCRHTSTRLFVGRCFAAFGTIAYTGACVWIGFRALSTPPLQVPLPSPTAPVLPPNPMRAPPPSWQQCSRADPLALQIGWALLSGARVCWIAGRAVGGRVCRAVSRWNRRRRARTRVAPNVYADAAPLPTPAAGASHRAWRDAANDALAVQRSPQRQNGGGGSGASDAYSAYSAQHRIDAYADARARARALDVGSALPSASAAHADVASAEASAARTASAAAETALWSPPHAVTAQLALLRAAAAAGQNDSSLAFAPSHSHVHARSRLAVSDA